jgi:hypothetical protein
VGSRNSSMLLVKLRVENEPAEKFWGELNAIAKRDRHAAIVRSPYPLLSSGSRAENENRENWPFSP